MAIGKLEQIELAIIAGGKLTAGMGTDPDGRVWFTGTMTLPASKGPARRRARVWNVDGLAMPVVLANLDRAIGNNPY
jgi:hypothetical protein